MNKNINELATKMLSICNEIASHNIFNDEYYADIIDGRTPNSLMSCVNDERIGTRILGSK